eukprot:scaffold5465_cov124-Pinguiococcus_pyrenoidosus.AAC.1
MFFVRGILGCANAVASSMILNGGDGNPDDEDRVPRDTLPEVTQRAIAPGNLIERWVAGDRELDPVFVA